MIELLRVQMRVPHVEPQIALALFLIRPMTGVALRREDWTHVAIEFETLLRGENAGSDEKRECEDEAHALANLQFRERHSLLDFRFSVLTDDFCRDRAGKKCFSIQNWLATLRQ